MSARMFLRRATRTAFYAFAFTSSPFVVVKVNSLLTRPSPIQTQDPNIVIKLIEKKIELVMAGPFLHEDQKSRITKILSANIDQIVTDINFTEVHKKVMAACQRAAKLDAATRSIHFRSIVASLLTEQLALEREKSRLAWESRKLTIFAPWGDAGLYDRVVNFSSAVIFNGFASPVTLFILEKQLRLCLKM